MSTTGCTPVAVEGWGGAGDGCEALAGALDVLGAVSDGLRAAFPGDWQSSAADEFAARLGDLLGHAACLEDLLHTARERADALAAAVAAAWSSR